MSISKKGFRIADPMRMWLAIEKSCPLPMRFFFRVTRKVLFYPIFIYQLFLFILYLIRMKPDLLHVNGGGYPAALSTRVACIAGKICRVKHIILVVNNIAVPYQSFQRFIEYPIDVLVKSSVTVFVTGSNVARTELEKVMKLDTHRTCVINNGVEVRELIEAADSRSKEFRNSSRIRVGVVGVLEPRKGHLVVIESISELIQSNQVVDEDLILLIEGLGNYRKILEERTAKLHLKEFVIFTGHILDIHDFISSLDILVLPSIEQEDFPNVILEAMALRIPVIATDVGGISEQIIDGETGIIVPPNQPSALASAIHELISSPEQREILGSSGRERYLQNFTAELAVSRYLDEYNRLLRPQEAIS
jgi:glycosyltransferase involved in cell wall biosynthesis